MTASAYYLSTHTDDTSRTVFLSLLSWLRQQNLHISLIVCNLIWFTKKNSHTYNPSSARSITAEYSTFYCLFIVIFQQHTISWLYSFVHIHPVIELMLFYTILCRPGAKWRNKNKKEKDYELWSMHLVL